MTAIAGMSGFLADRRGNFAVIFALCLVPVMALVGAAVDYSRMVAAQGELQDAADAGALAAATSGGTEAQRQRLAEDFVQANAPGRDAVVRTTLNARSLVVEVSANLPLPVLSAFGKSQTVISVTAQVENAAPAGGTTIILKREDFERRARRLRRNMEQATRHMPRRQRERFRRQVEMSIEAARGDTGQVRLSR